MNATKREELKKLALDAYVYGFPLVYNMRTMVEHLDTGMIGKPVDYNGFSQTTELLGPDFEFVTPNNDTLYSWTPVNLTGGPLLLEIPEVKDRYYVGQFIDAWTNNFAYVGTRGTNGDAKKIYLLPPNFKGELPEPSYLTITAPTEVFVLLFRVAVKDKEDLKNAIEIQKQYKLTPLPTNTKLRPIPQLLNENDLDFFINMVNYMNAYPASEKDRREFETKYSVLGLNSLVDLYAISEETREILVEVANEGVEYLRNITNERLAKKGYINGWDVDFQAFDYNDTYFELGAINKPQYVISDRKEAILVRALSALGAMWGNNGYEALYLFLWKDEYGESLTGDFEYELTFDPPPHVDAFWSLTMYNLPNFYLVDNEINRYSIGDRTKGIKYNEDGSITIYMSNKMPADEAKLSNWLPAPSDQFRPVLRTYLPQEDILEGRYTFPSVKKIQIFT